MKLGSAGAAALMFVVCLLSLTLPAAAALYTPGDGWLRFDTTWDSPAPVSGYGDFGGTYSEDSGIPTYNEPFEFHLTGAGVLKVTDVYLPGDYFRIFNTSPEGVVSVLPLTSAASYDANFAYDYDNLPSTADAAMTTDWLSHGTYNLGPGSYRLQFQNVFQATGDVPPGFELSEGWFRVDQDMPAVPEPGTVALLCIVAGGAMMVRRRRR